MYLRSQEIPLKPPRPRPRGGGLKKNHMNTSMQSRNLSLTLQAVSWPFPGMFIPIQRQSIYCIFVGQFLFLHVAFSKRGFLLPNIEQVHMPTL